MKQVLGFYFVFMVGLQVFAGSVDVVELQWVLCEPSESSVFQKLQIQPGVPSVRDVYYSETVGLDLFQQGAVLRSRVAKEKIKTAAKVRDYDEAKIPWEDLRGKDFKCEMDAYIGRSSIACSLNYKPTSELRLYSADQALWIQKSTGFRDFAALRVLGPAFSREWQWRDERAFGEDFVLESVRAPKSFYSLELSMRAPRADLARVQTEVSSWLRNRGVVLCEKQSGKTGELLRALLP